MSIHRKTTFRVRGYIFLLILISLAACQVNVTSSAGQTEVIEETQAPTSTPSPSPPPTSTPTLEPTCEVHSIEEILPEDCPLALQKLNYDLQDLDILLSWQQSEIENVLTLKAINESCEEEIIAYADIENGKFNITTERNEPYKFDFNKMAVVDEKLCILNSDGEKILSLDDNGEWVADTILYLAAGENPRLKTPNPLYPDWPMAVDCRGLPTGIENLAGGISGQNGFDSYDTTGIFIELDSQFDAESNIGSGKVGFYDIYGYLHIYDFKFGGKFSTGSLYFPVFGQFIEEHSSYRLVIMSAEEVFTNATECFSDESHKLVGLEIVESDPMNRQFEGLDINTNTEIYQQFINALRTGDNFPEVDPDFFLYAIFVNCGK